MDKFLSSEEAGRILESGTAEELNWLCENFSLAPYQYKIAEKRKSDLSEYTRKCIKEEKTRQIERQKPFLIF